MRIVLFALLILILTACTAKPDVGPTQAVEAPGVEQSMKGYDLVSWAESSGQWRFVMVPGTNRQKSRGELLSMPAQALDVAQVNAGLASLAHGQTVIWQALPGETQFLPPDNVVREVRAFAESRGIELVVPGR